jgi:L-threonylcarbamoyladenylate synthase
MGFPIVVPTETVYGLAAPYNDEVCIQNIFRFKERPADNPLIVHISSLDQLNLLTNDILEPDLLKLTNKFWPGPLTILFNKTEAVSDLVTAGLSTVAVRMPSHPVIKKIIDDYGCPLVAPSANTSGKPSPTSAQDAYEDMHGKVKYIFDAGDSEIGLESTVIKVENRNCMILRQGKITAADLKPYFKAIVENSSKASKKTEAPGMKYKHYAPNAKIIVFEKSDFGNLTIPANAIALTVLDHCGTQSNQVINFESEDDLAKNLFKHFRKADRDGIQVVYVQNPTINMALANRIFKASEG